MENFQKKFLKAKKMKGQSEINRISQKTLKSRTKHYMIWTVGSQNRCTQHQ